MDGCPLTTNRPSAPEQEEPRLSQLPPPQPGPWFPHVAHRQPHPSTATAKKQSQCWPLASPSSRTHTHLPRGPDLTRHSTPAPQHRLPAAEMSRQATLCKDKEGQPPDLLSILPNTSSSAEVVTGG